VPGQAEQRSTTVAGPVVPGLVRVGVAIGIPQPWGGQLDAARRRAGDPQAELIPSHVTLLGPTDVPEGAQPEIEEHLAEVARGHRSFPMQLRGTGTFRPVTEVVFVAIAAGISNCELLAAAVRSGPLERVLAYPYHPHVTVAHDLTPAALDSAFEEMSGYSARFTVDHFTSYVHGADGRWRPVRDYPLLP
jgi:2'-5' RNA ligase